MPENVVPSLLDESFTFRSWGSVQATYTVPFDGSIATAVPGWRTGGFFFAGATEADGDAEGDGDADALAEADGAGDGGGDVTGGVGVVADGLYLPTVVDRISPVASGAVA